MAKICEELKSSCRGCPEPSGSDDPSAFDAMLSGDWGKLQDFEFAGLPSVFSYLRGGKRLSVPADWKDLVPSSLG